MLVGCDGCADTDNSCVPVEGSGVGALVVTCYMYYRVNCRRCFLRVLQVGLVRHVNSLAREFLPLGFINTSFTFSECADKPNVDNYPSTILHWYKYNSIYI